LYQVVNRLIDGGDLGGVWVEQLFDVIERDPFEPVGLFHHHTNALVQNKGSLFKFFENGKSGRTQIP